MGGSLDANSYANSSRRAGLLISGWQSCRQKSGELLCLALEGIAIGTVVFVRAGGREDVASISATLEIEHCTHGVVISREHSRRAS